MAETASTMLPLGTPAPDFALEDAVSGRSISPSHFDDATPFVVMFVCNHCPFVVHVRAELARLAAEYSAKGVAFVAINSNSLESHPQDGPAPMKELATQQGWGFPYLFDPTQETARAYRAACTPDFFVFDGEHKLAYRGQLDDSRPGSNTPVTGRDVRTALDRLLAGERPDREQKPSIGCNIKWAPENEPEYFG